MVLTAEDLITDSYVSILTVEQLAYQRRRAADPYASEDGRCHFGRRPGDPAACEGEALYEWHATRSDTSGRPGVDWHYEIAEPVCERHASEREGRLF